jgi:hypothetical protein
MAVDRTWRSPDRRWLVDQVVEEPGVEYRVWDAEGLPAGEAATYADLRRLVDVLGIGLDTLERVPTEDPWCE